MQRRYLFLWGCGLVIVVLLIGGAVLGLRWLFRGGPLAAATPTPARTGAVTSVQIRQVWVTTQTPTGLPRVVVQGVLPNPCVGLPRSRVTLQGSTFIITLEARQQVPECPGEPTPFEIAVPLPVEGLPPGTYSVLVQGQETTFVWAGQANAPLPPRSQPDVPAPTDTSGATPPPLTASIVGEVWQDLCRVEDGEAGDTCRQYGDRGFAGDGIRQSGEPALVGVQVLLTRGACPSGPLVAVTSTDDQGRYRFDGLEPGTYCVRIDESQEVNASLLPPGLWTQPQLEQGFLTVELAPGSTATVNFARFPNPEGFLLLETITPTPTPELVGEPLPDLGPADVVDSMETPSSRWFLVNQEEARFVPQDGRLVMYAYDLSYTNYWGLSAYPPLQDAYLEGVFLTGPVCQGRDRYGFIVRAPSPQFGIVVLAACSGEVLVFRWDGSYNLLRNWTPVASLNPGPNQTNRLGVWMEGTTLKIYVNRSLAFQVEDTVYTQGRFGLVIGAERTSGFWAAVDEVAYWLFP